MSTCTKSLQLSQNRHFESLYGYDVLPTLLFPNTTYRGYHLPYPSEREIPCWTEYTAYRIVACQEPGLFDRIHQQPPPPYLLYGGYWYATDFEKDPDVSQPFGVRWKLLGESSNSHPLDQHKRT